MVQAAISLFFGGSMKLPTLIALALVVAPAVAEARLSSQERRMTQIVEQERERSISLLERLVNQNSGSLNLAGVEAVGRMMRAELEPLGFEMRWVPMAETGRAGHLIAVHRGNGRGKRMLLIGHLDTVFEVDSPFQLFVRTGDEEDSGNPIEIARRDLIAAGKRADVALDFEGLVQEGGLDMGSIARRSSGAWELRTSGKSGHSSRIFSEVAGNGAIYEMARILAAFRAELPEPNLTFNVGLIAGGATALLDEGGIRAAATGKTNIIPEIAIARGDIRTLSREQEERVQGRMREIVARHLPGAGAEIVFATDGYPAMAPTAGNKALLDRLNAVNRDLGLAEMAALDPLKRGAGDISFVAADVDGLVGLGTASEGDHAPGETVDLASIDRQAKRAAILMTRLSKERR
jgi:glutamate carboxypeptidase